MATKLIEFGDGIVVEVGAERDKSQAMSEKDMERLKRRFDAVTGYLQKLYAPIQKAFVECAREVSTPVQLGSAEVEIGVSFSAEGNLFVAKTTGEASLTVKFVFEARREKEK